MEQRKWQVSGHHPMAAFGNSDGDLQMLQYTSAGTGLRLCFLHHDDAEREYADDRNDRLAKLNRGFDDAAYEAGRSSAGRTTGK